MYKYSVVIPVYNVIDYIDKCLESVLNQTVSEIEIIIVDDGSTDGSEERCDYYARSFPNCVTIHQENRGLSAARNAGFFASHGEYVYFLDSDDFIEKNLFEIINNTIEEINTLDLISFEAKIFEEGILKDSLKTGKEEGVVDGIEYSQKHIPISTVPLYCYRKQFLIDKEIQFFEGIYYEDVLFTAQVFLNNPKVVFLNKELYNYNRRLGSITKSSINSKRYRDITQIITILLNGVINKGNDEILALRRIYKTYLMLSEEVYYGMNEEARSEEKETRKEFLKNTLALKRVIGLNNTIMTINPKLFWIMRQARRTIRRGN